MKTNENAVATQNASVEMNKKVEELEFKLNDALVMKDIYWSIITKNGKHLISTEEDFVKCMFAITDCDYSERIKELDLFKEGRGKIYLVWENGWNIRYENIYGTSIVLSITDLSNAYGERIIDKFDNV